MELTEEKALAAATRGAKKLDKMVPGWHKMIKRKQLNLALGTYAVGECGCILAQLALAKTEDETVGYYSDGLKLVGMEESETAARFGFTLPMYAASRENKPNWDRLTKAWKILIRERLKPAVV